MLCVSCQWFASNCCWGEWGPLGIRVNCVSWNTRRLVSLYIAPYDMPLHPRRLTWIPKYAIFEAGDPFHKASFWISRYPLLIFRVAIPILKETGSWFRLVRWLGVIWGLEVGISKFMCTEPGRYVECNEHIENEHKVNKLFHAVVYCILSECSRRCQICTWSYSQT